MANKSNPAAQTISTPQGGGVLQGTGETFSPDLHTGTGNFSVPIALPSGRNGFQPQLNLIYSTEMEMDRMAWSVSTERLRQARAYLVVNPAIRFSS
jgi:hypothetical protein